jgi:hypothetical protein
MNESTSGSERNEAGERRERMTRRDKLLSALEKAITRAEEKSTQVGTARTLDSSSKADAAIQKLRENRRLSREELDRPVTI